MRPLEGPGTQTHLVLAILDELALVGFASKGWLQGHFWRRSTDLRFFDQPCSWQVKEDVLVTSFKKLVREYKWDPCFFSIWISEPFWIEHLNICLSRFCSSFIFGTLCRNGILCHDTVHSEYDLEVQQHRPRWPDDCWWVSWRNHIDWYNLIHGLRIGSSHPIKTCRLKYKEQFLRNCRKQDYRLEVILEDLDFILQMKAHHIWSLKICSCFG